MSSPILSVPADVAAGHILSFLEPAAALAFARTCKGARDFFNDPLHFEIVLKRDFPQAAASFIQDHKQHHKQKDSENEKSESKSTIQLKSKSAKEEYFLQLSILAGYNARWYRVPLFNQSIGKARQGFGKTQLLGHPVVFGGWAAEPMSGGISVDCDIVYLAPADGKGLKWMKLDIGNCDAAPQHGTYCTTATSADSVPGTVLRNVPGFSDLAQEHNWKVDDTTHFPVIFVSGGVAEGAYRFSVSFLHAVVGIPKKDIKSDQKSRNNRGDRLSEFDWSWLELSAGILDEIPAGERHLTRIRERVPDAIPDAPNATLTSHAAAFGGSTRACHYIWYDPRLHCLCTFGGFCDTLARKAWVEGGAFDKDSDKIGNDSGNLPESEFSGHRALHHLEAYDLRTGGWSRVLQSGADPIARFGCSVMDITDSRKMLESQYIVMGGCTGRHNHKGWMTDGDELQDPASHRILDLERCNDGSCDIRARWRVPFDSERCRLQVDSAHLPNALGRLHASCKLSERSQLFFGGGNPVMLTSSVMLMKRGLSRKLPGYGINWRWSNLARPLGPYHVLDGNEFGGLRHAELNVSRSLGQDVLDSHFVPPPYLVRNDCMLIADTNRPGEAILWGGWRCDELGDCYRLVIGNTKRDEEALYGKNRTGSPLPEEGVS